MSQREGLLAEYAMLQDEIASNSNVVAQVFAVTVTAVAALMGYGIERENWLVLLTPFAVLLPSLWFVSSQLESTVRIAAYIKVSIEPRVEGLSWERSLSALRRRNLIPERRYTISVTGIYGALGAACLILSWRFVPDYSTARIAALAIVSVLLVAITTYLAGRTRSCFTEECHSSYEDAWTRIMDHSEHENPDMPTRAGQ